jgi:hypothetical protein
MLAKSLFIYGLGKDIGWLIVSINIDNFDIFPLLVISQKVIPNVYVLSVAMFNGIMQHADCILIVS